MSTENEINGKLPKNGQRDSSTPNLAQHTKKTNINDTITSTELNNSPNPKNESEEQFDKNEKIEKLRHKNQVLKEKVKILEETIKENEERELRLNAVISKPIKGSAVSAELEKLRKDNAQYQKEILILTNKLKQISALNNLDKIPKLEALLKQKERDIEQLANDKRVNDRVKREQDKLIEQLKQEKQYYHKVAQELNTIVQSNKKNHQPDQEANQLVKEKLMNFEKKITEDKKLIKQQLNVILLLDEKYKALCQKAGLTPNPLLDQANLNEFYKRKNKNFQDEVDYMNKIFEEDDSSEGELSPSAMGNQKATLEYKYQKLVKKYDDLRKFNDRSTRKLKAEINILINKLNSVEVLLVEKEKEIELFRERMLHKKNYSNNLTNNPNNLSRFLLPPLSDLNQQHNKQGLMNKAKSQSILANVDIDEYESPNIYSAKVSNKSKELTSQSLNKQQDNEDDIFKESKYNRSSSRDKKNSDDDFKKDRRENSPMIGEEEKETEQQKEEIEDKEEEMEEEKNDNDDDETNPINKEDNNIQDEAESLKHADEDLKDETELSKSPKKDTESKAEILESANENLNKEAEISKPIEHQVQNETNIAKTSTETTKDTQQSKLLKGQSNTMARIHLGNISSANIENFDDLKAMINHPKVDKLKSIQIWNDKEGILGIQVNYILEHGIKHAGPSHILVEAKDRDKRDLFELDDDDHIKIIKGVYTIDDGIINLEFVTRKGQLRKFGPQEAKGSGYYYEFKKNEKPTYLFGSFIQRSRPTNKNTKKTSKNAGDSQGNQEPLKQNISSFGFRIDKFE